MQECDPAEAHKYGIVGRGEDTDLDGFEITGMVEKPKPGTAPSNLYINGRYILQPEIFGLLENQERGAGNEIQLTDAMLKLMEKQSFFGYHFKGRTFDCGSPGRLCRGQCRVCPVAPRHLSPDRRFPPRPGRRDEAGRAAQRKLNEVRLSAAA